MSKLRLPSPFSLTSVSLVEDTNWWYYFFSLNIRQYQLPNIHWSILDEALPYLSFQLETGGPPVFPYTPFCIFEIVFDPARTKCTHHNAHCSIAPAAWKTKASWFGQFRGSILFLQYPLSTLRANISDDYARLASDVWLGLIGWDSAH